MRNCQDLTVTPSHTHTHTHVQSFMHIAETHTHTHTHTHSHLCTNTGVSFQHRKAHRNPASTFDCQQRFLSTLPRSTGGGPHRKPGALDGFDTQDTKEFSQMERVREEEEVHNSFFLYWTQRDVGCHPPINRTKKKKKCLSGLFYTKVSHTRALTATTRWRCDNTTETQPHNLLALAVIRLFFLLVQPPEPQQLK